MRVISLSYSRQAWAVSHLQGITNDELRMTKCTEAVEVFPDVGADVTGVEIGQRGEGGKGALVASFEVGGSIQKKHALTFEDAETASAAAEGFAADGQADLFCEGEEFVESGLEVHGGHLD